MAKDRTGTVLTLLVLVTTVVFGVQLGAWDRVVAAASTLTAGPLVLPSDLGALAGLAVLFLGTVVAVRYVVAP